MPDSVIPLARLALIGFGEAARAFFGAGDGVDVEIAAYDIKTGIPAARDEMLAAYAGARVQGCETAGEALAGAGAALSLVTADQALAVAETGAARLAAGAFWFDLNSVAPGTKRVAAGAIEVAGGRYVDVAVMAPVHPRQRAVPLLASGPHAEAGAAMLRSIGFSDVRVVGDRVGAASAIKMIRSVMVKGLEALTTECVLAADQAGVLDEVIASLNANWPGVDWAEKADYNLDRMMVHGMRRAAEMEEVVKTLDSLGTGSQLTRGTVERQRAIGVRGFDPGQGLAAKLRQISAVTREAE